jgi:hypothetical protein
VAGGIAVAGAAFALARRGTSLQSVDVRPPCRVRSTAMPGTAHTISAIVSPCRIIAIAT